MVYKWYILPIGGLYATYHLLEEPENNHCLTGMHTIGCLAWVPFGLVCVIQGGKSTQWVTATLKKRKKKKHRRSFEKRTTQLLTVLGGLKIFEAFGRGGMILEGWWSYGKSWPWFHFIKFTVAGRMTNEIRKISASHVGLEAEPAIYNPKMVVGLILFIRIPCKIRLMEGIRDTIWDLIKLYTPVN